METMILGPVRVEYSSTDYISRSTSSPCRVYFADFSLIPGQGWKSRDFQRFTRKLWRSFFRSFVVSVDGNDVSGSSAGGMRKYTPSGAHFEIDYMDQPHTDALFVRLVEYAIEKTREKR